MKKLLLLLITLLFFQSNFAQTISIIGDTSPSSSWTTDTDLTTTDNINYTINNVVLTTATGLSTGLKFRQDHDWNVNWGGNTFPNGIGQLGGQNIQTLAGTYNITFNKNNGSYTFIQSSGFPNIGIWGPAVNSQLGYGGADVKMTTNDGVVYTLSGFYFSSGNAYFRQDDNGNMTFGSTTFPSGVAVSNGPSLFIPGAEWFVTFNRISGDYSFTYPSIGILGTALNGFNSADTDLTTTDGFNYTISNLLLTNGEVKFRKDNLWTSNWGSSEFPSGTGTQNGANIPVNSGTYNITFDKSTGNYNFTQLLSTTNSNKINVKIFPNPTNSNWTFSTIESIQSIEIVDILGKSILTISPKNETVTIDASLFTSGIYFAKIATNSTISVVKLIKN